MPSLEMSSHQHPSRPSSGSNSTVSDHTEKVNLKSQILERPSIDEYWNIFGVPVLPENVIFTFFRMCWCYSEAYNTGTQKWSSIVQYSCTSIWDLKYTFSHIFYTFWKHTCLAFGHFGFYFSEVPSSKEINILDSSHTASWGIYKRVEVLQGFHVFKTIFYCIIKKA